MKIIFGFLLFLGALAGNLYLQKGFNDEFSTKPHHIGVYYWTLTLLIALFGFATQVVVPYKIIFNRLSNKLFFTLWLCCVAITTIFRVSLHYISNYDTKRATDGFWAFSNDFASWVFVPFIIYCYHNCKCCMTIDDTSPLLEQINISPLRTNKEIKQRNYKFVVVCLLTIVAIGVDTVEFSTDIDALVSWWVYAVRIPVVLLSIKIILHIDNDRNELTNNQLLIYVILFNYLQIVLNDMSYVILNILSKTSTWETDLKNHHIFRGVFLFLYTIMFVIIKKVALELIEKFKSPSDIQILTYIFSFYDTFMITMMVVTNNTIDIYFFIFVFVVMARKNLFFFANLYQLPEKLRKKCCSSYNYERTEPELIIKREFTNQFSAYLCYIIAIFCFVIDYYISGDLWLGGQTKTISGLNSRVIICSIYLFIELVNGLIVWQTQKSYQISLDEIIEAIFNMYSTNICYVWIITFSYVLHLAFFWEPI